MHETSINQAGPGRWVAAAARLAVLVGLAAVCLSDIGAAAERRVALVVGAGKYEHAATLANPVSDAREIAAALKRLGFDVDLVLDPSRADLENAVRRLGQRSRGADASLFYYSGHAIQAQGVNWVLPVSANIDSDRVLRFEALDLDAVREQVEGLARISLIFLDACRDDPFKQRVSSARDLARGGLASVNTNVSGSFVAFATSPGVVAADGNGAHSPFTGSILKFIETPGLELHQMMEKVIDDVEQATDQRQIPWQQSSLKGDFYFNPANTEKASESVVRAINGPGPQVDLDSLFWESVDKKKAADLNAYLVKFPQGAFAELARNRLAELNATPVTAAAPDPKLVAALAVAQANLSQKQREDFAAGYKSGQGHKAIAAFLAGNSLRVFERESPLEAEESSLESCEVFAGAPCVLVVVDDEVKFASDSQPRPMPRALYMGAFDPERIPSVKAAVRQRPDIVGYRAALGPKAAAYHPFGYFFVTTGAASQFEAEQQVLKLCNDDSQAGARGPCFLYASSNDVVLPRRSRTPLTSAAAVAQQPPASAANPKLLEALARAVPSSTPKFREETAASYQAGPQHKALVVDPNTGRAMWVTNRLGEQEAEESDLERCEVAAGRACVLIAVNDDIRFAPGSSAAPRTMPRVHYAGPFNPERIPSVQQNVRQRSDVAGYSSAQPFRAAAYHDTGSLYVISGAASQRAAEEQVLALCNGEAARTHAGGPCYLYASGDAVVLTRRSTVAITDAPVAAVVTAPPAATTSFHDAMLAQLARALPRFSPAERETTIKNFEEGAGPKGFAVHSKDNGYWRLFRWPAGEDVAESTLEGCQSYYGDPCALLAVDDVMKVAPDAAPAPRDMPRVRYEGTFDPRMIPAVMASVRGRADMQAYARAGGAKAVAFHPWGQAYVAYSPTNQFEAESNALASCNNEPSRQGKGGPCYLYAAANQVVFPKRLRLPMTPAVAAAPAVTTPVVTPPVAKPVSGDDALIASIAERLVTKVSTGAQPGSMAEAALQSVPYRSLAQTYITDASAGHKALAAGRRSTDVANAANSITAVVYGAPSPETAQSIALERCQVAVVDQCILIAFDRNVAPADGSWKSWDMGRVHYDGLFDPVMIPGLLDADRNQSDVKSYYVAPLPKAAVITNTGKLFVVTGASSQAAAEQQAFTNCGARDGCYLYAAGNQVMLQPGGVPQRTTRARFLGNSLLDTLSYALVSKPDKLSTDFRGFKGHKAMVLFPELRVTWTSYNSRSGEDAERSALEICGLKFNTTCVTLDVDDRVTTRDPSSGPRNAAARLAYQGAYRPEMVPTFDTPPSVAHDYVKMRSPKAMAIRPVGPKLAAETGATLAEAEAKALAKCADPDSPYPCFIYAENDNVVLPLRRTEPSP